MLVWRGVDSNHRRSGTDRFTVCCRWPLGYPSERNYSVVFAHLAGGGIRTRDLLITNQVLYQLSYTGKAPELLGKTCHPGAARAALLIHVGKSKSSVEDEHPLLGLTVSLAPLQAPLRLRLRGRSFHWLRCKPRFASGYGAAPLGALASARAPGLFGWRRRITSASSTAAETDALSEATCPSIGMRTR